MRVIQLSVGGLKSALTVMCSATKSKDDQITIISSFEPTLHMDRETAKALVEALDILLDNE
jgi:hypothetical protein